MLSTVGYVRVVCRDAWGGLSVCVWGGRWEVGEGEGMHGSTMRRGGADTVRVPRCAAILRNCNAAVKHLFASAAPSYN